MATVRVRVFSTLVVAVTVALPACQLMTSKAGVRTAAEILAVIAGIESAIDLFEHTVGESVSTATHSIQRGDDPLVVAEKWQDDWEKVHEQYQDIVEQYNRVTQLGNQHLEHIRVIASEIHNDSIREAQLALLRQDRDQWDATVANIAAQLAQLEALLKRGDDVERVLQIHAVRSHLLRETTHLERLATQSEAMIRQIEFLFADAKRALGSDRLTVPSRT